jgi:hypothetical protein
VLPEESEERAPLTGQVEILSTLEQVSNFKLKDTVTVDYYGTYGGVVSPRRTERISPVWGNGSQPSLGR